MTDETNEEEFDPQAETATVVQPNPAVNGNGHVPVGDAARKITVQYAGANAGRLAAADLMGRINRQQPYAKDTEKAKDDREWLDAFMLKPEAGEYQLCITRYYPNSNADGDPVPTGIDSRELSPVCFYDELQPLVADIWGGGRFRVTISDSNGRRVDDITRCILLDISTTAYPPKRTKYEKIETTRGAKNSMVADPVDDELTRKKRERELLLEEERIAETMDRKLSAQREREFKTKKRDLELQQLERELNPRKDEKSAELALLEKRLEEEKRQREDLARKAEEERKERDRKYDEDRKERDRRYEDDKKEAARLHAETTKAFMDQMARMNDKLVEVQNRPAENTMEKMMAVMAPIVTAIITKPAAPLPDNKEIFIEMGKAQAESTKQIASMTTAMLTAPKTDPNASSFAMMMKLMENDKSGKDNLMANLIQAIINNKDDKLTPDMMIQLINMGEKRADKLIEMTQGIQHGGEEGSEYDPALGFLGNAGKALFGSLKALMDSAANNPAILDIVKALVGNKNPSNAELAQAAWRLEQQGMNPQQIAFQQQPQLPPVYTPTDTPYAPYPPRPNPAQPQQRQGPPRVAPPPQPPAQSAVANELEGAASGLPSNGDPEQQVPLTAEELAEENLRDAVTRTVELMIGEAKGKPQKRAWPEDATANWNADFIKAICDTTYDQMRLRLLDSKCERSVASQLNDIWLADVSEQRIFWDELHRFVDLNMKRFAPQPVPAQNPPPTPQTPVTPQNPTV